jgi:hypothetical protein
MHRLQLLPMLKLSADDYVTAEALAEFTRNRVLPRAPGQWFAMCRLLGHPARDTDYQRG